MGRGNFCPYGELTYQWYIDYDNYYYSEDEEDEHYEGYDYNLMEIDIDNVFNIIQKTFPSFESCNEWKDNYWGQETRLCNKLFEIGVADNTWSKAIYIKERDNLEENFNLAEKHFESYKKKIQDILIDYFHEIYLRNGAWMSSRIVKEYA